MDIAVPGGGRSCRMTHDTIIRIPMKGGVMVDDQQPGPKWRRSTRCANNSCVEVAMAEGSVLVRDSKDPEGRVLTFTPAEWEAFATGIVAGDFTFD